MYSYTTNILLILLFIHYTLTTSGGIICAALGPTSILPAIKHSNYYTIQLSRTKLGQLEKILNSYENELKAGVSKYLGMNWGEYRQN